MNGQTINLLPMAPKKVYEDQKILSECERAHEKEKVHQQKKSYEKNQERHEKGEEKGEKIEGMIRESKNSEITHAKGENSVQRVVKKR